MRLRLSVKDSDNDDEDGSFQMSSFHKDSKYQIRKVRRSMSELKEKMKVSSWKKKNLCKGSAGPWISGSRLIIKTRDACAEASERLA